MLHAHLLPSLTTPEALSGGTVVVIDVLRASTTITHALASGAKQVIPCLEIEDARKSAAGLPADEVVLGGERGGLPIEGFHLGNSPIDYTRRKVEGKTVVFTTTNGTRAMMQCRQAQRVLIGSFVNLDVVMHAVAAARMADPDARLHLLCAGTSGHVTREDVMFAGRVVLELMSGEMPVEEAELNDSARIARDCWLQALSDATARIDYQKRPDAGEADVLALALRSCQGGRNLRAIGLEGDIDAVAQVNRFRLLPELDIKDWSIRLANLS